MKRRFRGGRVAFLSQGLASGGNFVLSVLLIRALGLEGFGALSVALILVGYAAGMCQALVCQPLLSLAPLVEGEERRARVRDAWVMAVAFAATCGVAVLGAAGAWAGSGAGLGSLGLSAGGCAALVSVRVLAPALRAGLFVLGHGRLTVALDGIGTWGACGVLAACGLWREGAVTVSLATWVLAAASAAACLVAAAGWRWTRSAAATEVSVLDGIGAARVAWPRHWKSGRWLAANQVLSWFGSGGLHAATVAVLGPAGVGAIRAAQSLVGVLLVGCQALELALPGRAAAALTGGGYGGLLAWSRWQAAWLGGAFAVAGGLLALAGPWLITALFPGVDSELAQMALAGLCWLPVASVVAGCLQVGLRALERTRPVFLAYAVSSLASAAVALPVVEAFGLAGAAWGFTGTQGLFAVLLWATFPRSCPVVEWPLGERILSDTPPA